MKKWVLSRRDSLEMIKAVESSLGVSLELSRSAQASCEEPEDGVVFVHIGEMVFVKSGETFVPFLGSAAALSLFPSATVDAGAIKFLLNGADVMRPGIRTFDGWGDKGRTVVIREEQKARAIAVGTATVPSEEASAMTKGVCLTNVHHVGDRFWVLYKTV
ncbi:MAG TPA: PUA domain-containing protein [Nitrososphaerales archaeon]|nr:PUA domain-containing protein [Nitrososphaerales archaeon]